MNSFFEKAIATSMFVSRYCYLHVCVTLLLPPCLCHAIVTSMFVSRYCYLHVCVTLLLPPCLCHAIVTSMFVSRYCYLHVCVTLLPSPCLCHITVISMFCHVIATSILCSIQFNSIYFKTHNIKKTSNTNINNKSHGRNEIQLRNMF